MGTGQEKLLSKLIVISKIDASLAQMAAERKRIENEIEERISGIKSATSNLESKAAELNEGREKYRREDKRLKEEQQRLIDRRKALASFGDYKTQQAAEKEIEQASKQLSSQEENLILLLDSVDLLEKEYADLKETSESEQKDFGELERDSQETFVAFEERQKVKEQERAVAISDIDAESLQLYDRVHSRYPQDAVVSLDKITCTGCFMQVGQQMAVQISRGDQLVRCRGCGRILYLEE